MVHLFLFADNKMLGFFFVQELSSVFDNNKQMYKVEEHALTQQEKNATAMGQVLNIFRKAYEPFINQVFKEAYKADWQKV